MELLALVDLLASSTTCLHVLVALAITAAFANISFLKLYVVLIRHPAAKLNEFRLVVWVSEKLLAHCIAFVICRLKIQTRKTNSDSRCISVGSASYLN